MTWTETLSTLMERANAHVQQGNRLAASKEIAAASELLFTEAAKADTLDRKTKFAKRAGQLLEMSLLLRGEPVKQQRKNMAQETSAGNVSMPSVTSVVVPKDREETLKRAIEELNALVGLQSVKTELHNLFATLKIEKARAANSLKVAKQTLHYVFTGNPGTGKTTVARIIAKIFYGYGILETDNLTEVTDKDLVAGYVGQTAIKTDEVVLNALDGVLFIDEAYALTNNKFGQEAIDTLVKQMEDNRDQLIVIAAGYPAPMQEFITANPGLKDRFTRSVVFEDYSVADLCSIFEKFCADYEYQLTETAKQKAEQLFTAVHAHKDEHFGNARYVRTVFEKTLVNQSVRLAALNEIPAEKLPVIEAEDIPHDDEKNSRQLRKVVEETVAALMSLGHHQTEAKRLVDTVLADNKTFQNSAALIQAVYELSKK